MLHIRDVVFIPGLPPSRPVTVWVDVQVDEAVDVHQEAGGVEGGDLAVDEVAQCQHLKDVLQPFRGWHGVGGERLHRGHQTRHEPVRLGVRLVRIVVRRCRRA